MEKIFKILLFIICIFNINCVICQTFLKPGVQYCYTCNSKFNGTDCDSKEPSGKYQQLCTLQNHQYNSLRDNQNIYDYIPYCRLIIQEIGLYSINGVSKSDKRYSRSCSFLKQSDDDMENCYEKYNGKTGIRQIVCYCKANNCNSDVDYMMKNIQTKKEKQYEQKEMPKNLYEILAKVIFG